MKAQWLNGWTRETFLKQIEEMNGFETCMDADGENCVYRGENEKACLVGAFIPDEKYKSEMEKGINNNAQSVIKRFGLNEFMPLEVNLMQELQIVHDDKFSSNKKSNSIALFEFLEKHGL